MVIMIVMIVINSGGYSYHPLVICYVATENGHRNSEFFHEQWSFSIARLNYQRLIMMIVIMIVINSDEE